MEKDPTCSPLDPLLTVSADASKPYPTQPIYHNVAGAENQPASQPPEDYKTFDIVRATQFGVVERCMELIEAGHDVNKLDNENVSLLHWAAINNRGEVVKYYLSKGAIIDRIGGDLRSTPLHWASRQSHLAMVVLLVTNGADPSLIDAEGYAAIHLAAQFGHSSVVAYLLAKGQDPDLPDANGMTPLMWTSMRIFGPDPMRLLLTFNASVGARDKRMGNTALHWACMAGNRMAVKLLLDAGADPDAKNIQELTPLDISIQKKAVVITENLRKVGEERGVFKPRHPIKHFYKNKKFRRYTTLVTPFVYLGAFGLVFHLAMIWWFKAILLLMIAFSLRALFVYVFEINHSTIIPLAVYLATKFWMYFTWFVFYWPYVNSVTELSLFGLNSALLMYYFWKSWKSDPGIVKSTREDKVKTIVELSEKQSFELDQFCSTCVIRRPLRSKHCSVCKKCVARMDHHCPWIDNCVGAGNQHFFVGYLFFLMGMISWCAYGAYQYWLANCLAADITPKGDGFATVLGRLMTCSPWVFWIGGVNAFFHFCWVGMLLGSQIYQIMFVALTTNERLNFTRYKHLNTASTSKAGHHGHSHGATQQKSPFHRGVIQNLVDTMGWRCCGAVRPLNINWHQIYSLEDYAEAVSSQTRHRSNARLDLA